MAISTSELLQKVGELTRLQGPRSSRSISIDTLAMFYDIHVDEIRSCAMILARQGHILYSEPLLPDSMHNTRRLCGQISLKQPHKI